METSVALAAEGGVCVGGGGLGRTIGIKWRSDPHEGPADFNPVMEIGEDFASEGSRWTFVVRTRSTYTDKVAFRTIRK